MSTDLITHDNTIPGVGGEGFEGLKAALAEAFEAFPDLRAVVVKEFGDGDLAGAHVSYTGTQLGEFAGIPPTGKRVEYTTTDMCVWREGKCIEVWSVMDLYSLMTQITE